jgi:adenine specific DNA methylase Mod
MPVLDWIGKKSVVNHHREVAYRLVHCDKAKSAGDPEAGNLLVQGDNLEALKALLPYYAGKVKCIYIDPPYNTGNEGWVYNDNVSSPEIRAWLGRVVGREAEDLSRHDKWLCMMYPRLRLLREFLSEDGSIWVSIDDEEGHYCKVLLDEIFGRLNFVATVIWQKADSPRNSARQFSDDHDYILVYAKDTGWKPNRLPRTEAANAIYDNPDDDERGDWLPGDPFAGKPYSKGTYVITGPTGREFRPPPGRYWRVSEENFWDLDKNGRIWWGPNKDARPSIKRYLSEVSDLVARTFWSKDDVGSNRTSKNEMRALFPGKATFETPKPEALIERILRIATVPGDYVLDSFLGSGTTAAVAHKMGRAWIGVEMGEHAATYCAPRLSKVIEGDGVGISSAVEWKGGGGYRYCFLGDPLFDGEGNVGSSVTFADLAAHVFFCETGSPIPKRVDGSSPLIGTFQGRAIYLLFSSASMGLPSATAGNVLTAAALQALPSPGPGFTGTGVVYAEGCTVPDDRLAAANVTFRQVPYQIEGI